jgi:hypothetical protein
MDKKSAIKVLENLVKELEAAYYGGFRHVTDEEDHEAIKFAINELSKEK